MPAFVKSRFGESGIRELEGTIVTSLLRTLVDVALDIWARDAERDLSRDAARRALQ